MGAETLIVTVSGARGIARSIRVRCYLIGAVMRACRWLVTAVAGDLCTLDVELTWGINEEGLRRRVDKGIRINGQRP